MRFAIVIEKAEGNYGAYSPDIPGCVAVGDTVEETISEMRDAIAFHFEGMVEDGEQLPVATSLVEYVDIELPVAAR